MRDNQIVKYPSNPLASEPLPSAQGGGVGAVALKSYSVGEMGTFRSLAISFALHLSIFLLIWFSLFILQFFGINLLTFDRPQPVPDIEFQLVDAPEEAPRDPNTRNRAQKNSRAGGTKIPNVREAQPMKQAGQPQPKASPAPQVAQQKPAPKPAPVQSTKPQIVQSPRPQQQPTRPAKQVAQQPSPTPSERPAPPRPRVTAPKPSTNSRPITSTPNPLAPIKVPDAPGPVAETGPLVRGPAGGESSGTGSGGGGSIAAGPSTVPGQFSGGSTAGGGGPAGQGGRGSYSQYGSPGGGGGRAGIDAVAEPDFGPYLAELQRRIRRNWTPPEDKEDKSVVLLFTIAKDGRLMNINVKRSSGFAQADQAARAAVERSAPFRALPAEYRNSSINVEFTFDYNVYTGGGGGIRRR